MPAKPVGGRLAEAEEAEAEEAEAEEAEAEARWRAVSARRVGE
jgi:hypothetical protein